MTLTCIPNRERNAAGIPSKKCKPACAEVLLIGRDPSVRVYVDEVLARAGFQVHGMTPWDAGNMVNHDFPSFPLVIFNNTVHLREATQIARQLRRQSPASRLLLILGPDVTRGNLSRFDSVVDGLAGPATLVSEARRLASSATRNGAQIYHNLPSA